MKNGWKRAAVVCLSAGLMMTTLAGCSKGSDFNAEATAITVNDSKLPAGVVNFAVRYMQVMTENLYMSLGITDPYSQDIFGTGTTLGEETKDEMTQELSQAMLAEQKMEDYGVSVTDEDKQKISDAAAKFMADNDEETLKTLGATQETVERYLELSLIRSRMEPAMSADVDTEVSDEEAAQRKIQYVIFTVTDAKNELEAETETETETVAADAAEDETGAEETEVATEASAAETEATTEARSAETELTTEAPAAETEGETAVLTENEADKTQSAAETETEAETTAEEAAAAEAETDAETESETEPETEDAETAAARELAYAQAQELVNRVKGGEDMETAADDMGKTASEMTFGSDYAIEELVTATDGLADGTLVEEPVETSTGYYVVKLISQLDREATDAEKESIVTQRKNDRISELYDEWEEAGEVTIDEDVMAKIVFDYHLNPYETEMETEVTAAELAETEAETEVETEALAETEAETEAGTEAPAETEAGTEAPAETEAESEAPAETEAETEAVSE